MARTLQLFTGITTGLYTIKNTSPGSRRFVTVRDCVQAFISINSTRWLLRAATFLHLCRAVISSDGG
jgi:hypothetical protein